MSPQDIEVLYGILSAADLLRKHQPIERIGVLLDSSGNLIGAAFYRRKHRSSALIQLDKTIFARTRDVLWLSLEKEGWVFSDYEDSTHMWTDSWEGGK